MSETELSPASPETEDELDEDDRLRPEFVRAVLDAVDAGENEAARALVEPLHPADIADLFELTPQPDRAALAHAVADILDGDVFAEMNRTSPDVVALVVARNTVHPQTVVVERTVSSSGIVAFPRLVIDAAENSEITVIERFTSADGVDSLVVPVAEIRAAQSARVTYLAINELGANTWQIGHQLAVGERRLGRRAPAASILREASA